MEPATALKRARRILFAAVLVWAGALAASDTATVKVAGAAASGIARVVAGETLAVDLTGYELPPQAEIVVLQVYNHYYYHSLEAGRDIYRFSADSGRPVQDAPAFSGLQPMDPVFLLIGREASPGSLDTGAMLAHESIMIIVE